MTDVKPDISIEDIDKLDIRVGTIRSVDEVADSERSVVYQQAENRLHAQKAVMLAVMRAA